MKVLSQKADVLVIGSGGAGIRAAIELYDNHVDVLIVGKCKKRDAHTILATGGINAALGNMDKDDSWPLHAADTIKDGGMINDPQAVKILCKHAAYAVQELATWGCPFHREKDGKITQRFFGAATYRRACFVGDSTGRAILNTLVDQALKRKIRFKSEVYIFSLLTVDEKKGKKGSKKRVNGALGLDLRTGNVIVFSAKVVVLATGGHSRVFSRSSSRFWENNGDGISLAYNVGAQFMDMEMFQFHPTGMVAPKEAEGVLVTEAVRGEGGLLTNTKGERFMVHYDKPRMELSARDVVARAIYMEVQAGRGTKKDGVYLDISHQSASYIKRRLPRMVKQFRDYAKIDITKQKMQVAPTAHYSMGGVLVDHKTGKTTVPGLYAIGEVTSGMHGGNRLGGNSLAEIVVFGRLTGDYIAKRVGRIKESDLDNAQVDKKIAALVTMTAKTKGENPIKVKEQISRMMWQYVGVARNEKGMKKALTALRKFAKVKLKTGRKTKMNEKLIAALDVSHMFSTCAMIIDSALLRTESRAAHYRTDYKNTKKSWQKNIICIPNDKKSFRITTRKVPAIPKEIAKHIKYKRRNHMLE